MLGHNIDVFFLNQLRDLSFSSLIVVRVIFLFFPIRCLLFLNLTLLLLSILLISFRLFLSFFRLFVLLRLLRFVLVGQFSQHEFGVSVNVKALDLCFAAQKLELHFTLVFILIRVLFLHLFDLLVLPTGNRTCVLGLPVLVSLHFCWLLVCSFLLILFLLWRLLLLFFLSRFFVLPLPGCFADLHNFDVVVIAFSIGEGNRRALFLKLGLCCFYEWGHRLIIFLGRLALHLHEFFTCSPFIQVLCETFLAQTKH